MYVSRAFILSESSLHTHLDRARTQSTYTLPLPGDLVSGMVSLEKPESNLTTGRMSERVSVGSAKYMPLCRQYIHPGQDLQHQSWLLELKGKLSLAPIDTSKDLEVLDAGSGTGAWSVAFAKQYPATTVTGVDINPSGAGECPDNCNFLIADLEEPWAFAPGKKYDFVHVQMLTVAIHDWPLFLQRCKEHLKPTGWLEIVDVYMPYGARNPMANPENSAFLRVGATLDLAWGRMGVDSRACDKHPDRLRLLGFESISQHRHQSLAGEWPESEPEKTEGRLRYQNWSGLMSKIGPTMLSKALQMDEPSAKRAIGEMLEDMQSNGAKHQYYFPQ